MRTDQASGNFLELFKQLISFCNYCILPMSSKIVCWSSTNLRLASVESRTLKFLQFFDFIDTSHELHEDVSFASWLFMNKLLISSMAFFCFSATKFFLQLDRFTHFLYTSSVIISKEFVFSNIRLTVGENLLHQSVQMSHTNLCMFKVFVLDLFSTTGSPVQSWYSANVSTTGCPVL